MRTVATELKRFFRRRATWLVTVATVLVAMLLSTAFWYAARPPSPEVQAQLERDYQQALADWQENSEEWIQQCLTLVAEQRQTDPSYEQDCSAAALAPSRENYTWPTPTLTDTWRIVQTTIVPAVACFLALIAVATFIGAEFSSGNIATWLTFEPRRTRVYLAKLIACAVGSVCLFVVGYAATMGGSALAVSLDGGSLALPNDYWLGTALAWFGRGAAVVAAAGCAGGALTFLLRRTIGVLGLAMGYLVVGEVIAASIVSSLQQYTLYNNICAFVNGEWTYLEWGCHTDPSGGLACETATRKITFEWASIELGAIFALCLLVGWLVFRRRDVAS